MENFVSAPIVDKPIKAIPGLSGSYGIRLVEKTGYRRAYQVLGQFLILEKNETAFTDWLKEKCKIDNNNATKCYSALNAYCAQYV